MNTRSASVPNAVQIHACKGDHLILVVLDLDEIIMNYYDLEIFVEEGPGSYVQVSQHRTSEGLYAPVPYLQLPRSCLILVHVHM